MHLRKYLAANDINHEDFAAEIGISRQTLRMILKGMTDPRFSIVKRIVKATNEEVNYDDIMTSEDLDSDSKPSKKQ